MREKLHGFRQERIGDCWLINADCKEVLQARILGAPKGWAVLTDPPYGIGIAANPVRQRHERKQWDNATPHSDIFDRLLECSQWQIIWGGNYFDLPPQQCFLVWDKVQPQNFSLAMCEMAWTNIPGPARLFRRHVVSYSKDHPTQKPLELMQWCIERFPNSQTILDPFMGSGTTGVACVKLGRKFIGIEIDEGYFNIACRRIREAYAQPDMFIEQSKEQKPEQLSLIGAE